VRTVTGTVRIETGDADGSFDTEETVPTYETLEDFLSTLRTIGEDHDVLIQAFDARYVAGEDHLRSALEHAKRSMERGENVADDLAVEVLCYAAGRRQIDRAMELGVGTGQQSVIVLLDGEGSDEAADAVRGAIESGPVEPDEELIADGFEITPAEREATAADLSELVQERVALLDVEK
jgi:KEOPS complex subunit Cgi121